MDLADKSCTEKVAEICMSIDMDDPALTYFTSVSTIITKIVFTAADIIEVKIL